MWPWEHVVFAYVLYSLGCRLAGTTPRSRKAVGLLAFGAILPDLIDKPLAWQWGIFETGYGLGHSMFLAVPVSVLAVVVAYRAGRPRYGVAFAVGYLSHLLGDLISPYLSHGSVPFGRIFWPVMEQPPSSAHGSFLDGVGLYLEMYRAAVFAGDPDSYILAQTALAACAVVLWIADGMPGLSSN